MVLLEPFWYGFFFLLLSHFSRCYSFDEQVEVFSLWASPGRSVLHAFSFLAVIKKFSPFAFLFSTSFVMQLFDWETQLKVMLFIFQGSAYFINILCMGFFGGKKGMIAATYSWMLLLRLHITCSERKKFETKKQNEWFITLIPTCKIFFPLWFVSAHACSLMKYFLLFCKILALSFCFLVSNQQIEWKRRVLIL